MFSEQNPRIGPKITSFIKPIESFTYQIEYEAMNKKNRHTKETCKKTF